MGMDPVGGRVVELEGEGDVGSLKSEERERDLRRCGYAKWWNVWSFGGRSLPLGFAEQHGRRSSWERDDARGEEERPNRVPMESRDESASTIETTTQKDGGRHLGLLYIDLRRRT